MFHLSNKQEVKKVGVSYLNLTFAEKQQVIPVKKMKKNYPAVLLSERLVQRKRGNIRCAVHVYLFFLDKL